MSHSTAAAFAVPGDLTAMTGGYHYDRQLLQALRDLGCDVTHVPLPEEFPFPDPRKMSKAIKLLAEVPPERVLIVDGLAFGALETAALEGVSAPLVALVHHPLAHESGLPDAEARRLHALEQANLDRAAHILVPSPHIKDLLVSDYGVEAGRVTVIRPGRPKKAALALAEPQEGPPLILAVGLLHPRKGHDILISALARLADLRWRAVIVGTPWEPGHEEALAHQIDEAALAGRVQLAGRIEQQELDRLYREAHLFALATRFEGYGIVFDEALMHGLPIVSTTAGAVPGTVPPEAGILVPPGDADAFAEALRAMLMDQELHAEMAQAAARAGAALPTWADAAAQVAQILDKVAGGRP
jgi:glycosyltransferase involved in cell wall biosynthesis